MTDTAPWTLEELAVEVGRALSQDYEGPADPRAREIPDLRTLRYYTTLGLLDRPSYLVGRTGHFGRRHLMQMVALKRLQAEGLPLSRIQQELAGADDDLLSRIARLPIRSPDAATESRPIQATPRRSSRFWTEEGDQTGEAPPPIPQSPPARRLIALQLAPGVTLLVDSDQEPSSDLLAEIPSAAEPLLAALRAHLPTHRTAR